MMYSTPLKEICRKYGIKKIMVSAVLKEIYMKIRFDSLNTTQDKPFYITIDGRRFHLAVREGCIGVVVKYFFPPQHKYIEKYYPLPIFLKQLKQEASSTTYYKIIQKLIPYLKQLITETEK